jgi:hypothetical protein
MDKQMHNAPLPRFLVHLVAVVLPWCEGAVGLLMILGLWTSVALIAGSLLMLMLQIGTCLAQNIARGIAGRWIGGGRGDGDKTGHDRFPALPRSGETTRAPAVPTRNTSGAAMGRRGTDSLL